MIRALLVVALAVATVTAYPQHKAKVVSGSEVSGVGSGGDTFDSKVNGDANVKTDFQGKGGLIKNDGGTVSADQAGKGDSFNAIGPKKETAKGTVDKGKKVANLVDAKGNKVVGDASDGSKIKGVVNGKDTYTVTRNENGHEEVFDKNKNSPSFTVDKAVKDTDQVDVRTPGKPQHIPKLDVKKDGSGKIQRTVASDAENQIPNIPLGTKRKADLQYQTGSKSDIQIGQSFGSTNLDALSVGANGEVSSDEVKTKPCYTGPAGQDALDEKTGIKIDEKSIKWELNKDKDGNYAFPGCINATADVQVPPNVNTADLAFHDQTVIVAAQGEMQCDPKVACLDKTTANRPTGSCFFCDFCKKEQPQGAFGLGSDANLCEAKAGQTLKLKWQLCPPEKDYGKFAPFLPSGQKTDVDGDIVSVIRVFLRSAAKKWEQVACKQAGYSFKVGLAGQKAVGSKPSATKLENPPKSVGSNGFQQLIG